MAVSNKYKLAYITVVNIYIKPFKKLKILIENKCYEQNRPEVLFKETD